MKKQCKKCKKWFKELTDGLCYDDYIREYGKVPETNDGYMRFKK